MHSTSTSRSEPLAGGIPCRYYNGVTSRPYYAEIVVTTALCQVRGEGINRTELLGTLNVSEHFAGQARIVRFPDGAFCEIDDSIALGRQMKAAGHRGSIAEVISRNWKQTMAAFIMVMGILAAAYHWGLPFTAEIIAERVPRGVLVYLTESSLAILDKGWLNPSKLPVKKQNKVAAMLAKVKLPPGPGPEPRVVFRDSPALGANAFALPDGTILFMDKLVQLAGNNRKELIAVYAHEAGHIRHRHALRQLIQNSVLSAFLAVYLGDVSSAAGALAGMVMQSKYSRDFERMADTFAAEVLLDNNIPPAVMGTILKKLETSNAPTTEGKKSLTDYISTHPATEERIRELKSFVEKRKKTER